MFSSDHGYSQGQYRIPTHKMQVYDNNLRVPLLIRGPGIPTNTLVPKIASMVDVGPTLLELAAGNPSHIPSQADGRSFASFLVSSIPPSSKPWKDTILVTYQSIHAKHCPWRDGKNPCGAHPEDGNNNTYQAMRVMNDTHNLLYAEFTDVSVPANWNFPESGINFHELYDMIADPYQLHNLYYLNSTSADTRAELSSRLQGLMKCKGQPVCP